MKWIVGYTQTEALAMDATMLANARTQLKTAAEIWGAFKHPDKNEWCVPYDEERAALAQLFPNQTQVFESKKAEGKVKDADKMKEEQWHKPGKDPKEK